MLYRSTRNKLDSYTSYRVLRMDRGTDGGFILPLRLPVIDKTELENMHKADFLQNVADILKLFFGTNFTAWDMESAIGKMPFKMVECGQKITLVQCWKNPISQFEYYEKSIFRRLCPEMGTKPTLWACLAIRISLVAATILQLPEKEVDIAVNAGDFRQFFVAYYCRMMGLPVRKILVACNENSNIWDFVNRGYIHGGISLLKTSYPAQDKVIPDLFEPYLYLAYGYDEVQSYLQALDDRRAYQIPKDMDVPANDDLFVSVIGQERIPVVVNSFHSNNGLEANKYTAFSLGVLQDYRAKAGESTPTLVFEESAP